MANANMSNNKGALRAAGGVNVTLYLPYLILPILILPILILPYLIYLCNDECYELPCYDMLCDHFGDNHC